MLAWLASCSEYALRERTIVRVPNLYGYQQSQVMNALGRLHLPEQFALELRRNSEGSCLYCFDTSRSVAVISSQGTARTLRLPAEIAYLNDRAEFVAWSDDLRRGVDFVQGYHLDLRPGGRFRVDPGGRFYSAEVQPAATRVSAVQTPDVEIFRVPFSVERIFASDNLIYVFGRDFTTDSHQREMFCRVLENRANGWNERERITIQRPRTAPSPFSVVDMDTGSEKALIIDVHDPPFKPMWYLFGLKSRYLQRIGAHSWDYAFFLKGDLLMPGAGS